MGAQEWQALAETTTDSELLNRRAVTLRAWAPVYRRPPITHMLYEGSGTSIHQRGSEAP